MEQYSQYLMRMKSKYILNSPFQSASMDSFNSSWEEQAFAEDSHGPLGGFIWPPRSYSCSFCKREFRSAQALGGHMNVHRRDRARLKQSLSPPSSDHHQSPSQFPSYPSTSNSNPSLPFRVSPQENFSKDNCVETDLSVGLNLAVSRNRPTQADGNEEISSKRQKTAVFPLSFFLKPCSNERLPFHSEVLGLKTSSMEDIDLELRLGDSPTVK